MNKESRRSNYINTGINRKKLNQQFLIILLLFGILFGAIILPLAINGELFGNASDDTNRYFVPFRAYAMSEMAQGRLPQYVPIFSGHDVSGFGQGIFYPTTLLGLVFRIPDVPFFLIDLWLHWTLAAALMAALCLRIRLGLLPAIVAGAVYAFSGPVLWRLNGHWTIIHQIAFFPAVLILTEEILSPRWFRTRSSLIAFGGAILGLLLLAQNPQILYHLLFALVPYVLCRCLVKWRLHRTIRVVVCGSGCVALALMISAPVLLPMAASLSDSLRSMMAGAAFAREWSLMPVHLYSLLFSELFFCEKGYWGAWYANESLVATGPGPTLLAMFGFVGLLTGTAHRSRTRLLLPAWLIAAVALLGFGESMPWFTFLVEHVPLYASFRAHGRVGILLVMAIALLAAESVQILSNLAHGREKKTLVFSVLCLVGLACILALCFSLRQMFDSPSDTLAWLGRHKIGRQWPGETLEASVRFIITAARKSLTPGLFVMLSMAGLLIGTLLIRVWRRYIFGTLLLLSLIVMIHDTNAQRKFILSSTTKPVQQLIPEPIDQALREIASSGPNPGRFCVVTQSFQNITLLYPGLEDASGIDSNISARYGEFVNRVQGLPPNKSQVNADFRILNGDVLKALGIRWILLDRSQSGLIQLPKDKQRTVAQSQNLLLMEYLEPQSEIRFLDETQGQIVIKEKHPGYCLAEVRTVGKHKGFYQTVTSPHWRTTFNGKLIETKRLGPWISFEIEGPGILEFQFKNTYLICGIALSMIGWLLAVLLWIRYRTNRNS